MNKSPMKKRQPLKRKLKQWFQFNSMKVNWLIRQIRFHWATDGEKEITSAVKSFRRFVFTDPATGISLKYNLFIPQNYDTEKKYPLVLFIHDMGVLNKNPMITLIQGLGAVIWATPAEQKKHECFVLAPQYEKVFVNDKSEAGSTLDTTVALVRSLTNEYSIDQNKIYTTGQSMGCMSSIHMMIKYPGLFAAAFLVAGQWDPDAMKCLKNENLWIVVSEGDVRAFPGMNASLAVLEKAGAKISRATWSGRSRPDEFADYVKQMIDEGNNIKYSVLKKGTVVPAGISDDPGNNHVHTWRIAYTIEGIRDWLFSQQKLG